MLKEVPLRFCWSPGLCVLLEVLHNCQVWIGFEQSLGKGNLNSVFWFDCVCLVYNCCYSYHTLVRGRIKIELGEINEEICMQVVPIATPLWPGITLWQCFSLCPCCPFQLLSNSWHACPYYAVMTTDLKTHKHSFRVTFQSFPFFLNWNKSASISSPPQVLLNVQTPFYFKIIKRNSRTHSTPRGWERAGKKV